METEFVAFIVVEYCTLLVAFNVRRIQFARLTKLIKLPPKSCQFVTFLPNLLSNEFLDRYVSNADMRAAASPLTGG